MDKTLYLFLLDTNKLLFHETREILSYLYKIELKRNNPTTCKTTLISNWSNKTSPNYVSMHEFRSQKKKSHEVVQWNADNIKKKINFSVQLCSDVIFDPSTVFVKHTTDNLCNGQGFIDDLSQVWDKYESEQLQDWIKTDYLLGLDPTGVESESRASPDGVWDQVQSLKPGQYSSYCC